MSSYGFINKEPTICVSSVSVIINVIIFHTPVAIFSNNVVTSFNNIQIFEI